MTTWIGGSFSMESSFLIPTRAKSYTPWSSCATRYGRSSWNIWVSNFILLPTMVMNSSRVTVYDFMNLMALSMV